MDRLEGELGTQASVIRLNLLSSIGQAAAGQFGVRAIPTFVLVDGQGNILHRQAGRIDTDKVKNLVKEVNERK